MAQLLHPPPERFEPITARWLVPGGPLHDPERDAVDPGHSEPVTLVGRPPRELAGAVASGDSAQRAQALRRRRLILLLFVIGTIAAIVLTGNVVGLH